MHVQSVQNYCFSSSNMQICDVLVAVVVVVAKAPLCQDWRMGPKTYKIYIFPGVQSLDMQFLCFNIKSIHFYIFFFFFFYKNVGLTK